MRDATTVRVTQGTRDGLRHLANADGVTLNEEVNRLVRAERQRRIGHALSAVDLDEEDQVWLDEVGGDAVRDDVRR